MTTVVLDKDGLDSLGTAIHNILRTHDRKVGEVEVDREFVVEMLCRGLERLYAPYLSVPGPFEISPNSGMLRTLERVLAQEMADPVADGHRA